MKLRDIIDLAKSGYSVDDVKELIRLADNDDQTSDNATEDASEREEQEDSKADQEEQIEQVEESNEQEDLANKLKEAQELISKLQQTNIRADMSSNVMSDIDKLKDAIRSYM